MPRSPQSVSQLLANGRPLAQLQRRLAEQERLLQLVRQLLPAPLDSHCIGAIMRQAQLTLLVESPVWASRLRFLANQLRQQLQQRGLKCAQVRVRIHLRETRRRRDRRSALPLSQENAKLLRAVAEEMDDRALREALLRLSRHSAD